MLGANTEQFPHLILLLKHIQAEDLCLSRCLRKKASQYLNSGCLACAVMAQQGINLALIHGEARPVNRDLPIAIHLAQAPDPHALPLSQISRYFFEVTLVYERLIVALFGHIG